MAEGRESNDTPPAKGAPSDNGRTIIRLSPDDKPGWPRPYDLPPNDGFTVVSVTGNPIVRFNSDKSVDIPLLKGRYFFECKRIFVINPDKNEGKIEMITKAQEGAFKRGFLTGLKWLLFVLLCLLLWFVISTAAYLAWYGLNWIADWAHVVNAHKRATYIVWWWSLFVLPVAVWVAMKGVFSQKKDFEED
jgi:hypothetical protein